MPVFGDGGTRRDYTYVDDIVSGIVAALQLNPAFEILNLGESQTVTLLEVVSELENALQKKARLKFLPPQPGDMSITFADVSRATRILGYQSNDRIQNRESVDLSTGLFKNKAVDSALTAYCLLFEACRQP